MAWLITKDHVTKPEDAQHGLRSRVGWGTPNAKEVIAKAKADGKPVWRFKMYDDDHELYYEGMSTEEYFDPLDWAANDAGCTEIHYRQPNGKWEQL